MNTSSRQSDDVRSTRSSAQRTALVGALAACAMSLMAACSGAEQSTSTSLRTERTLRGDTTVVRTLGGSTWRDTATLAPQLTIGVLDGDQRYMFGTVAALTVDNEGRVLATDAQSLTVRRFDSSGVLLERWGRDGAGPGEFRAIDGGLAALSDGRVVVRDPGNARLQIFSSNGDALDTWGVISGQWRSREPLFVTADTLLTVQPAGAIADINNVTTALVRIDPDGRVIDTIAIPSGSARASQLTARSGGNNASMPVPWSPSAQWTWHPSGYFIVGNSRSYRVTLLKPDGALTIERDVAPEPVADSERAQEEERAIAGMRWLDPSWQWNGDPIPDTKPAFQQLFAARDGRIWVLRAGAQMERSVVEKDGNGVELRYSEQRYFDVFEADGTFLGSVRVPDNMKMRPSPVFLDNNVWAVTEGDSGELRITRYALQLP